MKAPDIADIIVTINNKTSPKYSCDWWTFKSTFYLHTIPGCLILKLVTP